MFCIWKSDYGYSSTPLTFFSPNKEEQENNLLNFRSLHLQILSQWNFNCRKKQQAIQPQVQYLWPDKDHKSWRCSRRNIRLEQETLLFSKYMSTSNYYFLAQRFSEPKIFQSVTPEWSFSQEEELKTLNKIIWLVEKVDIEKRKEKITNPTKKLCLINKYKYLQKIKELKTNQAVNNIESNASETRVHFPDSWPEKPLEFS